MEDIVTSEGPGRPGRAWGIVAVVVLLGLLALALLVNSDGTPSATPSASPSVSFSPRSPRPSPPPERIVAPRWTGPHDPLLLSYQALTLRQVRGETPNQLRDLGSPEAQLVSVRGGTVQLDKGSAEDSGLLRIGTVSYIPLGSHPVRVGEAFAVAPALALGTAWLVTYQDDQGPSVRGTARRVDLATRRVLDTVRVPDSVEVVAETRAGLVLQPMEDDRNGFVWDPRTRRDALALPGRVADVTESFAVVVQPPGRCLSGCVSLVNVTSGLIQEIEGLDSAGLTSRLSPDGTWLAGFAVVDEVAAELVAVEIVSGRVVRVAGSAVSLGASPYVQWSRDSATLYASLGYGDVDGQVVLWHAGQAEVRVLYDEGAWDFVPE